MNIVYPPSGTALRLVCDDDDRAVDLSSVLDSLNASLRETVESYCGSSVTVVHDGHPVTLTSPDPRGDRTPSPAVTSLAVPLGVVSAVSTSGVLVVFASTAGAFQDLAADLAFATNTELSSFALNAHLDRSAPSAGIDLHGVSVLHQAMGVLMVDGDTPEQARARIVQIAGGDYRKLTSAALEIIDDVQRGPRPPSIGPTSQAA